MQPQEDAKGRGAWASQLGFILAAAGSAIGLGNIWRFPYQTGTSGGAIFVLFYLLCVVLLAFPVMVAEVAIGRTARRNPVGAFKALSPNRPWFLVGGLGVLTGLAILSYYSVVAGWTLGYLLKTAAGQFQHLAGSDETGRIFSSYVSSPLWSLAGLAAFLFLTMSVIAAGVQKGIERISKIFMPLMLVLLLVLVVRSVTLPGSGAGVDFYLKPDFSKVTSQTVVCALGQAFFSLSLGMGAMITYGSYLGRKSNVFSSSAWICLADTSIALLAGLAIFPALFAFGLEPGQGAGLVFIVIPNIFGKLPLGQAFGTIFFLLLVLAALTSTISLLEVVTAYIVDEWKWSRGKAAFLTTLVTFLVAVPSALSTGAVHALGCLYKADGKEQGFLDLMDLVFGNFSLVIGALFIAIFTGWVWKRSELFKELTEKKSSVTNALLWGWYALLKVLCPIGILVILGNLVYSLIKSHLGQ
jgi:NSS family neurotransmitter:Na+ symporter